MTSSSACARREYCAVMMSFSVPARAPPAASANALRSEAVINSLHGTPSFRSPPMSQAQDLQTKDMTEQMAWTLQTDSCCLETAYDQAL